MRPSALLLLVVVTAGPAVAHGHPAAISPAARFWEQAMTDIAMPEDISDLVQKGNDHSPRVEHNPAFPTISVCGAWTGMCTASMVAATGIFFHRAQAQLRPGSTMDVSFPAEPEPAILPREVAEKLPFRNLTDVLAAFSIPAGSAEVTNVAATLSLCQSPPRAGEVKACTTSLESTVRSAMDMLGDAADDHSAVWMAASAIPRTGLPQQLYEVQAVTPLDGDRYVGCHKVPFPYRVYYCHMTTSPSDRAYVVSLQGISGGPAADMLAFCHLDTAKWNPDHPAFEVLHTHPGTPVCHFAPYANPVFGKKPTKV